MRLPLSSTGHSARGNGRRSAQGVSQMSRLFALALCASLAATASPAAAWGPIGHRVSAALAERNISGRTRAHVEEILGSESLPEAATWPDEERSNPDPFWKEVSPYHFVTLAPGQHADQLAS